MFLFPFDRPIMHPDVYLIYKTDRIFSDNHIEPDYICFNENMCQNHTWPILSLLNRTCVPWFDFSPTVYLKNHWDIFMLDLRQRFHFCFFPVVDIKHQELLFNCGQSFFMSKHRLNDNFIDCHMGTDEIAQRDTCSLNLANRFRCRTSQTQCIPRLHLADGIRDCVDGSDERPSYTCVSFPIEAGCKWKRGSLEVSTEFFFYYLCDGFHDVRIGNTTDEDNCPSSWISRCNSTFNRCDGYWSCRDGRDELGCPSNTKEACKNETKFYCMDRKTSQFVCHLPELAGDGHEDCIGAIDERVGGFCQQT